MSESDVEVISWMLTEVRDLLGRGYPPQSVRLMQQLHMNLQKAVRHKVLKDEGQLSDIPAYLLHLS